MTSELVLVLNALRLEIRAFEAVYSISAAIASGATRDEQVDHVSQLVVRLQTESDKLAKEALGEPLRKRLYQKFGAKAVDVPMTTIQPKRSNPMVTLADIEEVLGEELPG